MTQGVWVTMPLCVIDTPASKSRKFSEGFGQSGVELVCWVRFSIMGVIMAVATSQFGQLTVSKFILGSNPFSGFSHQSMDVDVAMKRFFSTAHIKDTLRQAEAAGVTTFIGRADHHIMRILYEYWDEGGSLQWLAQTCPELGTIERGVQNAIHGGAKACYVHGGVMDHLLASGNMEEVPTAIAMIKDAGLTAGVAGHNPAVFHWAEEHLDVDFYMCSYYNPIPRVKSGEHIAGTDERFHDEDREAMVATIQGLSKPVIHYKVLAAGRNNPREALQYVARHMRTNDAVCVGVFPQDKPDMLAEDVQILEEALLAAQI